MPADHSQLQPIQSAAWRIVARCIPPDSRPLSEHGRREMMAYLRMGGTWDAARAINWDIEPPRWAMRHEIECAARVAEV